MHEASTLGIRVEERRLPNGLCGVYYEPAAAHHPG